MCSPHQLLGSVKQIVFLGGAVIEALDVRVLCTQPLRILGVDGADELFELCIKLGLRE